MHLLSALSLAATMAAALPADGQAPEPALPTYKPPPFWNRNDLEKGGVCPEVILLYARGSGEEGNLGVLGGHIALALETEYGRDQVWVQGIGGAYDAGVCGNYEDAGAPEPAIAEMTDFLFTAAVICQDSTVVVGGYSQGSALAAAASGRVSQDVRSKIAGVVLFGYTKNKQHDAGIPDFPGRKVKIFCNEGDHVCNGSLSVSLAHLLYQDSALRPAPEFLVDRIENARAPCSGTD